jgi:hypothetical protein
MAAGIDHNPRSDLWGGTQTNTGGTGMFGAFTANFGAGGSASTVAPMSTATATGGGLAAPQMQKWMLYAAIAAAVWYLTKK